MEARDERIAERVGRLIRSARDARGWSQAELAERLDLSVDHVGLMERGERMPSVGTLVDVARELKLSFDGLLGEEGEDAWIDEATAILRAVPSQIRTVVMGMLKAAVSSSEAEAPRHLGRKAERRAR